MKRYEKLQTWGYMLEGPGRPTLAAQRKVLQVLGVNTADAYGPYWVDVITRGQPGRRAGQFQLAGRNDLLKAVQNGDKLVVAAPYCLGISQADAAWFIGSLAALGVSLIVSNDAWCVPPGGDAKLLLEEVGRRRNTVAVASYRKRKSN